MDTSTSSRRLALQQCEQYADQIYQIWEQTPIQVTQIQINNMMDLIQQTDSIMKSVETMLTLTHDTNEYLKICNEALYKYEMYTIENENIDTSQQTQMISLIVKVIQRFISLGYITNKQLVAQSQIRLMVQTYGGNSQPASAPSTPSHMNGASHTSHSSAQVQEGVPNNVPSSQQASEQVSQSSPELNAMEQYFAQFVVYIVQLMIKHGTMTAGSDDCVWAIEWKRLGELYENEFQQPYPLKAFTREQESKF